MIEGLKPYAKYKESGQEWLGRCPKNWSVRRTKLILREVDSRSTTGKEREGGRAGKSLRQGALCGEVAFGGGVGAGGTQPMKIAHAKVAKVGKGISKCEIRNAEIGNWRV